MDTSGKSTNRAKDAGFMVQRRIRGKQDTQTWRNTRKMKANAFAVAAILASLAAMLVFREKYIDARDWAATCAATAPAWPCLARDALLWLQYWSLWGLAALALGFVAFLTGWFPAAVASVAIGAMAVANYNATWGVLGAALGVWVWIRPGVASR